MSVRTLWLLLLALPFTSGCGYVAIGLAVALIGGDGGGGGRNVAPVLSVETPDRVQSDVTEIEVTVTVADANAHPVTLRASFRTDGQGLQPMTLVQSSRGQLVGSDTVEEIETDEAGVTVALTWAIATDLLLEEAHTGVEIRLEAEDGRVLNPVVATTGSFVAGNEPPVVSNLAVIGESGNVTIEFDVSDNTQDPCDVEILIARPAEPFLPATIVVGATTALPTTTGTTRYSVSWASATDLPGRDIPGMTVRITPSDHDEGLPVDLIPVPIDNNDPPSVVVGELVRNPDNLATTVVEFTLFDGDLINPLIPADPTDVLLQWTTDGLPYPDPNQFGDLSDTATRRAILDDPDLRRALQTPTEKAVPVKGYTNAPVPAAGDTIRSTQLAKPLTPSPLEWVGRTLQILRPGEFATLATAGVGPGPIVFEPDGTTALVGRQSGIDRLALADGSFDPLTTLPADVVDLALNGDLLVALDAAGSIHRIDRNSGTIETLLTSAEFAFEDPRGIALVLQPGAVPDLSNLLVLITDVRTGDDALFQVRLTDPSVVAEIVLGTPLDQPTAVVVDRGGRRALVAETGADQVVAVDLHRHTREVILDPAAGLLSPVGLALRPNGRQLLITTANPADLDQVFELDLPTGVLAPIGEELSDLRGVAAANDGTVLIYTGTELQVRDGVEQERIITEVSLTPPLITVNAAFNPSVGVNRCYRVPRGRNPHSSTLTAFTVLPTGPVGVVHRYQWDTGADGVKQVSEVTLRAIPYDRDQGAEDFIQVGRRFLAFDEDPVELLPPRSLAPDEPIDPYSPTFWEEAALGDLDGDGTEDLVIIDRGFGLVLIYTAVAPKRFPSNTSDRALTAFAIPQETAEPGPLLAELSLVSMNPTDDDRLDIVLTDLGNSRLMILLQKPDGTFDPRHPDTPNPCRIDLDFGFLTPVEVNPADVDGDGRTDLVFMLGDGGIQVFLQESDGGFPASADVTLSESRGPVTVADADGDGHLDIASESLNLSHRNALVVFFQDEPTGGPPTFTPIFLEPAVNDPLFSPQQIVMADLDADGDVDVAAVGDRSPALGGGDATDRVVLYLQQTPRSYVGPVTIRLAGEPFADQLGAGDVDADGDLDLVVTGSAANGVPQAVVFCQTNPGEFHLATRLPFESDEDPSLTVGDFDGDGDLDVGLLDNTRLAMYCQLAPGPAVPVQPSASLLQPSPDQLYLPIAVSTGDVNGNGLLDILTVQRHESDLGSGDPTNPSGTLTIFEQTGPNQLSQTPLFTATGVTFLPPGPHDLGAPGDGLLADTNGDGALDIVSTNHRGDDTVLIFEQHDGDFDADPVMTEAQPAVVLGPGSPPIEGPDRLVVCDLDGDGYLDIVTGNSVSENLAVWFGSGSGFVADPDLQLPADGPVGDVAAADVDGNGFADLLFVVTDSDVTGVYLQPTARGFNPAGPDLTLDPVGSAVAGPVAVVGADVDGNGLTDVVALHKLSAEPALLRLYLQRSFMDFDAVPGGDLDPALERQLGADTTGPYQLQVVDMDRDGDQDLIAGTARHLFLIRQASPGRFILPELSGVTPLTLDHALPLQEALPARFEAVDLDGDGDVELIVPDADTDRATVNIYSVYPED